MNLRQLRYVVATADHGTMTAAAQAMFVAQPALSRAIRDLERELGVELFARAGRGVALTGTGEQIVRYARDALRAVDAIETLCSSNGHSSELRVASTVTLEPELTARLLPEFARDQPAVRVRVIRCESRESAAAAVRDGRADLALTELPVPGDLSAHPIEQRELVLVSPPATPLRDPVPLTALDGLPLVMPARGGSRRADLDAMLSRIGAKPVAAVESDERSTWLASVRAGVGSLLWYRNQVEPAEAHGLVIRSFTPALVRTIGLVHARRALPQSVRDFLAFARSR